MLVLLAPEQPEQPLARSARSRAVRAVSHIPSFWVYFILSNQRLTLDPLQRFSSRKPNHPSFMSCQRISKLKSSSQRLKERLSLLGPDSPVMRPCLDCSKQSKTCRVDDNSDSCIECIRLDSDCILFFSAIKWRRIRKKRDRVFRELKETFVKAARLQKQFEVLDEKKRAMIKQKFHNIAELEKKKKQASESSLNDLLFNMFFEQFKIFSDFNWLNFFAETVAEVFNSSWDFLLTFKCSRYVRNLFT